VGIIAALIAGAAFAYIAVVPEPLVTVMPIETVGFPNADIVPVVRHVGHEIAPAALTATGDVPLRAPPLVVVAQVGQAIVPVPLIVPPVTGAVVAMLVTVPLFTEVRVKLGYEPPTVMPVPVMPTV
jgi:hypothetical protein